MGKSIWESSNPNRQARQEGIAFGRITRVYPTEGYVEVKTFGSTGSKGDNHIPKCQWLNLDSKGGAKSAVIPQEDSYCLVFFIGGEPFVYGFFDPLSADGTQSLTAEEEKLKLTAGDRIIRTSAQNYIIVRTTGVLEFEATPGNFIRMFPQASGILKDLLRIQNKNFEFSTSGGGVYWREQNKAKDTLMVSEHRDNLTRTNIIAEKKGKVTEEIIHQKDYGVPDKIIGNVPKPSKTTTVKLDGETTTHIRPPGEDAKGVKVTSKPSGDYEISINGHTKMSIAADGTTTMDVKNGKVTIELGSSGKVSVTAKADIEVSTKGKLNVEATGKAVIKADKIDLDGGGELQPILTYPNTVSDFTGLPLNMSSKTVKASI